MILHSEKRRWLRSGFTLIEVLASMVVVVVLMMALARMFAVASLSVKRGTNAVMRNSTLETAMETLLQDVEGMIVNSRLPCVARADITDAGTDGFGFDELYFITTSGDQDDDRAYLAVRYRVNATNMVNLDGTEYQTFQLVRETWTLALLDGYHKAQPYGIDVMANPNKSNYEPWFDTVVEKGVGIDQNVIADNVVRFDIYLKGWDAGVWMSSSESATGKHEYDSTKTKQVKLGGGRGTITAKGLPPAAFDVYLQVASPEVMSRAGIALLDSSATDENRQRAREQMVQNSASLFGRAVPISGISQLYHPSDYYADP